MSFLFGWFSYEFDKHDSFRIYRIPHSDTAIIMRITPLNCVYGAHYKPAEVVVNIMDTWS